MAVLNKNHTAQKLQFAGTKQCSVSRPVFSRVSHSASAQRPSLTTCKSVAVATKDVVKTALAKAPEANLNARHREIMKHFESAVGVDDFMSRVELILSGYGFRGDNSIAMTNLCRDEVTAVLKDKIEAVFGSSFNTNGLGAVLTCGVTGMKAGLSHSPTIRGRERYVFFSFPHIAIDGEGTVGSISRPGRPGRSCACGALQKCLSEFHVEGYAQNCKVPGVHDPLEPEYSILKQRLARRLRYEGADVSRLDLVSITAAAERTMTDDLEYLIGKAVDTSKADYAVITGVQIHNWASDLTKGLPSLEFVAPTKAYVVVNGTKVDLDLSKVPSMSPRQIKLMATASMEGTLDDLQHSNKGATGSTLQGITSAQLARRLIRGSVNPIHGNHEEVPSVSDKTSWPAWLETVKLNTPSSGRDNGAPTMESPETEVKHTSFEGSNAVATSPSAEVKEVPAAASPQAQPGKKVGFWDSVFMKN
ncbi:hypothetical protein CEUSTIGMA_g11403.t1 [Chlamydomonas eustigma]|uniref:Limiting CO2-inducible protein B/C beta carbonyic anhydrase domain-containing protein n=1 Tax=Chlamydomonas eustigma TaxID=1157962 RepID=A0A250XLM7_9CHLO|nr:hypothetical protein CEUSTIGMA_g11403.t1 [Chlamydomonas eustigma]|eukprot:GAX83978.1 hypothetical protein CEUSTIGMA_g11403.t1 [Chlamydomonas eustigma]